MAPPRKPGPDDEELRHWKEAGLTQVEMARRATEKYGTPWSRQHIATRLTRAGLTDEAYRFSEAVPWRVRTAHSRHYRVQLLRFMEKRDRGLPVDEMWSRRVDKLLRRAQEENFVIVYNPAAPDDAPQEEVFIEIDRDSVPPGMLHPRYPISTFDPTRPMVSADAATARGRIAASAKRMDRTIAHQERQEGQQ
jgi:hypothetical protein